MNSINENTAAEASSSNAGGTPIVLRKLSKSKREKLSASWASNKVNILTACFAGGSEIFSVVLVVLSSFFLSMGFDTQSAAFQTGLNGILSLLCIGIPVLFMPMALKTSFKQLYPLKYKRKGSTVSLVMFGLSIGFLGNYAAGIISSYIDLFGKTGAPVTTDVGGNIYYSLNPIEVLIYFVSISIIPGILEEFAFRGVFLQGLRKYIGDAGAIFYSSLMFAMLHRNIVQSTFAFIVGLVIGYICIYSGSLIPGMLIHIINNAVSVVMSLIISNCTQTVVNYASTGIFIVILILGVVGFKLLTKNKSDFLNTSKVISNFTAKKRVITVIFSPLSIIVILYCLFYMALFIFAPLYMPTQDAVIGILW